MSLAPASTASLRMTLVRIHQGSGSGLFQGRGRFVFFLDEANIVEAFVQVRLDLEKDPSHILVRRVLGQDSFFQLLMRGYDQGDPPARRKPDGLFGL